MAAARGGSSWIESTLVGAVALGAIVPLAPAMLSTGDSLSVTIAKEIVWPQIFVSLFASRVLAEDNALRFAEFWRRPPTSHGPVQLQSTAAAFALAICLTFAFYLASPRVAAPGLDPAVTIIAASLMGKTIVHVAIVFLFFVILAHIGEAALLYFGDRVFLSRVRAELVKRIPGGASDRREAIAAIITCAVLSSSHIRGARLADEALKKRMREPRYDELRALSFHEFHTASRRFIRNLLPLLPMLGFLGTIIGLSTTLADLPSAIGVHGDAGAMDFSGALAGLAIKFQTTLLGLLASMVCGLCLACLERRESEFTAECVFLIDQSFDENP